MQPGALPPLMLSAHRSAHPCNAGCAFHGACHGKRLRGSMHLSAHPCAAGCVSHGACHGKRLRRSMHPRAHPFDARWLVHRLCCLCTSACTLCCRMRLPWGVPRSDARWLVHRLCCLCTSARTHALQDALPMGCATQRCQVWAYTGFAVCAPQRAPMRCRVRLPWGVPPRSDARWHVHRLCCLRTSARTHALQGALPMGRATAQ